MSVVDIGRRRRWGTILHGLTPCLMLVAALAGSGCSGNDAPKHLNGNGEAKVVVGYDTAALARLRSGKDMAFRGEGSPIAEEFRRTFGGLRYFPPNPAVVFDLHLRRLPTPVPVVVAESNGGSRKGKRIGTFTFTVEGTLCTLAVYVFDTNPTGLFLPFRDATNGVDSYSAGRYIDLDIQDGEDPLYRIDFNYAYNPYCAYNDRYICPRVPAENFLPVAIRAGEMVPDGAAH